MSELNPHTTGYMKPPKQNQFKKGKSGNPKGRPKQIENPYLVLQKVLKRKVQIKNDGRKIPLYEALMRRLKELAISGDRRAIQMLQKILVMANDLNGYDELNRGYDMDAQVLAAKMRFVQMAGISSEDDSVDRGKDDL
jgi:hypothetical protein